MADDLGVFGPAPDPPPKRTKMKVRRVGWEPWERLIPWAVNVPCSSEPAFRHSVMWLCDVLDRIPLNEDKSYYQACATILNQQLITRALAGKDGTSLVDYARKSFAGYRTGNPLSYVERSHILPSFVENRNDQTRIPLCDLLVLLGRRETDLPLVEDFLEDIYAGDWDVTPDYRLLLRDGRQMADAIRLVRASPVASSWERLFAISSGYEVPKRIGTVDLGLEWADPKSGT